MGGWLSHSLRASLVEQRSRLILFGLLSLLAVVLGFWTFTPYRAVYLVRHGGYGVMLLTFALFVYELVKLMRRADLGARWRAGGWKVVLFVLGVSAVLHVQEPHGFKVVNDEFVQISTSQRMHQLREVSTVARGFQLGTTFMPMQGHVDKRPMFYPFLLSVVHDLTGYRPGNAFLLNALLTPVLFGLVYLVARTVAGVAGGIAAVLLLATLPLLVQTIAGGGFEVLNLVMIVVTLHLGMRFARTPDATTLSAFCLSGVLLAQVRYESILFIVPVAMAILYVFWRSGRVLLPWPVLATPLLLVAYPLQLNVFKLRPELWQLNDRPSGSGVYSFDYFHDNVGKALNYFFSFDRTHANSHLVALAGIVGLAFFFLHLFRERRTLLRKNPEQVVFALFTLALFGQAVLMMCYFWGAYDEPLTVRLSLPTQLLFVLAFVFVYPLLVTAVHRWRVLSAVIVGYFFCWTMPTVAQRAYAHTNLAAETANWQREYLQSRTDRGFIVLDQTMPMLWVTHGVAAVSFDALAERTEEFIYHYQRRTFSDYLVVQKLEIADFERETLRPMASVDLGDAVTLETVREIVFRPTYVIRLSRIVSLDEDRLRTWGKRMMEPSNMDESAHDDTERKAREAELVQEWLKKLP